MKYINFFIMFFPLLLNYSSALSDITESEIIEIINNTDFDNEDEFQRALLYLQENISFASSDIMELFVQKTAITNKPVNLFKAYILAGDYYRKSKKNPVSALKNYNLAEEVMNEYSIISDDNKVNLFNKRGLLFKDIADFDNALNNYFDAEKIILKSKNTEAKALSSYIYTNIATVYRIMKDYNKSLQFNLKALTIFTELKDSAKLFLLNHNMAALLTEMQQYDKADSINSISLIISEAINNRNGIAMAVTIKAYLNYQQGNYWDALKYFKEALSIWESIGSAVHIEEMKLNIAESYRQLRRYDESIELFEIVDLSLMNIDELKSYQDGFSEVYFLKALELENYNPVKSVELLKKSIKHGKIADSLNQVMFDTEKQKSITNATIKYEKDLIESEKNLEMEKRINAENTIKYLIAILIIIAILIVIIVLQYRKKQILYDKIKESENQLSENNKLLSDAIAVKDKFFSVISHDLKGPVSSLNQLNKTIVENYYQLDNEVLHKYLTNAGKSSERLDTLLGNLLTWSGLQDKRIKPVMDNYALNQIIDDEINNLESNYKMKNLEIINNVKPDTSVFADKNMFSQIIRNILHNAIKFSYANGRIEIDIEENAAHCILSIKDNGIGISEEIKDKIFDVSNKTSREGTAGERGTGLGLNLAKEFAELNHGKIWFESAENKGTTFKIELLKNDEEYDV